MPNWTANQLTVPFTKENQDAIRASLFIPGASHAQLEEDDDLNTEPTFSYAALLPVPEILRHTVSGRRKFDGVPHTSWYSDIEGKDRPFTPEEQKAIRELGWSNWYDWSCDNWGVKWDATEVSVEWDDHDEFLILFDSPWGPPDVWFKKLKAAHPESDMKLKYRLEDEDPYPSEVVV